MKRDVEPQTQARFRSLDECKKCIKTQHKWEYIKRIINKTKGMIDQWFKTF